MDGAAAERLPNGCRALAQHYNLLVIHRTALEEILTRKDVRHLLTLSNHNSRSLAFRLYRAKSKARA